MNITHGTKSSSVANVLAARGLDEGITFPLTIVSARHRRERGQSLAEFALVLPLFLLVIMAAVDFGWAFRTHITATNAVREGARLGITGVPEDSIKATVVEKSSGVLTVDDVDVDNALGAPGQDLTVTASFDYEYITPLGGILKTISGGAIPSPLPLESTTVMRLE